MSNTYLKLVNGSTIYFSGEPTTLKSLDPEGKNIIITDYSELELKLFRGTVCYPPKKKTRVRPKRKGWRRYG